MDLPTIVRQNTEWGVRLTVKPFSDKAHAEMEISIDVRSPSNGRNPEISTNFTGVRPQESLKLTASVAWMNQMKAIHEEAKRVAGEMMKPSKPAKAVKKKAAKKA